MKNWKEKTWRIPQKGEVVKDIDGNIGIVTKISGDIRSRKLYVSDVNGIEIHTNEDSKFFSVVETEIARIFNLQRLDVKGYKKGAICQINNNNNIPLEIIHVEWDMIKNIPIIWLQDLRKFEKSIVKTNDIKLLIPFDLNLPSIDEIFSLVDSGLKWRLDVNLVKVDRTGWGVTGSPWEFLSKEQAIEEVENWKARLKIRRVVSVINSFWKIQFPCWTIDIKCFDDKIFGRVKIAESFNGFPAFFPTSLHAATALKMISLETWKKAFVTSLDVLF